MGAVPRRAPQHSWEKSGEPVWLAVYQQGWAPAPLHLAGLRHGWNPFCGLQQRNKILNNYFLFPSHSNPRERLTACSLVTEKEKHDALSFPSSRHREDSRTKAHGPGYPHRKNKARSGNWLSQGPSSNHTNHTESLPHSLWVDKK